MAKRNAKLIIVCRCGREGSAGIKLGIVQIVKCLLRKEWVVLEWIVLVVIMVFVGFVA